MLRAQPDGGSCPPASRRADTNRRSGVGEGDATGHLHRPLTMWSLPGWLMTVKGNIPSSLRDLGMSTQTGRNIDPAWSYSQDL